MLLMARELRSRREVEKAQNASLEDRGINQGILQDLRGLNVGNFALQYVGKISNHYNRPRRYVGIHWRSKHLRTACCLPFDQYNASTTSVDMSCATYKGKSSTII